MGILSSVAGTRIYLDTTVFIYFLEDFPPYAGDLEDLFQAVARGQIQGITSELSLAECLVKPIADGNTEARSAYESALRSSPELAVLPITRDLLVRAAEVRARQKFRLPDAIHLATAELAHCDSLLTNDTELKRAEGVRVLILSEVCGS